MKKSVNDRKIKVIIIIAVYSDLVRQGSQHT